MTLKAITVRGTSVSLRLAKHGKLDLRVGKRWSNRRGLLRHMNVHLLRFWQGLIERHQQSRGSQFFQSITERFIRLLQDGNCLLILFEKVNQHLCRIAHLVSIVGDSACSARLAGSGYLSVTVTKLAAKIKGQYAKLHSIAVDIDGLLSKSCCSADHDENCNQVFHGKQYDFGFSLFQGTNVIAGNSGVAR